MQRNPFSFINFFIASPKIIELYFLPKYQNRKSLNIGLNDIPSNNISLYWLIDYIPKFLKFINHKNRNIAKMFRRVRQ